MSTNNSDRPEPEFDRPKDPHVRATDIVEEEGLPEDNPFSEIVRELHEDGESWQDILWKMDDVYNVIDEAASEETNELMPKWQVAAIEHDPNSTSGERYEYYERIAETAKEAEEMIEKATGCRVEPEETEQIDVCKVC